MYRTSLRHGFGHNAGTTLAAAFLLTAYCWSYMPISVWPAMLVLSIVIESHAPLLRPRRYLPSFVIKCAKPTVEGIGGGDNTSMLHHVIVDIITSLHRNNKATWLPLYFSDFSCQRAFRWWNLIRLLFISSGCAVPNKIHSDRGSRFTSSCHCVGMRSETWQHRI